MPSSDFCLIRSLFVSSSPILHLIRRSSRFGSNLCSFSKGLPSSISNPLRAVLRVFHRSKLNSQLSLAASVFFPSSRSQLILPSLDGTAKPSPFLREKLATPYRHRHSAPKVARLSLRKWPGLSRVWYLSLTDGPRLVRWVGRGKVR